MSLLTVFSSIFVKYLKNRERKKKNISQLYAKITKRLCVEVKDNAYHEKMNSFEISHLARWLDIIYIYKNKYKYI